MPLKQVTISFMLSILLTLAYVPDTMAQAPSFDFHLNSFRCRFAKDAMKSLEATDPSDVVHILNQSISNTESALENEKLESNQIKILRTHLSLIKALKKSASPRSELHQFFQNLCIDSEVVVKNGAKAIAHTSNTVNQGVTFPFRFMFRFFVGLFSGKEKPERQLTWNEALGDRNTFAFSLYFLYQGLKVSLISNPILAPIYASPMIDTLTMRVCDHSNDLTEDEKKFCDRYLKTKRSFYDAAAIAQKWGSTLSSKSKPLPLEPWNKPVSENNLCEFIEHDKKLMNAETAGHAIRRILPAYLNPGSLTKPKPVLIETSSSFFEKTEVSTFAGLRNVVVSLAPPPELISEAKLIELKIKRAEFKKSDRKLGKLYREKNVDACNKRKSDSGFSYAEYKSIRQQLQTNYIFEKFHEQQKSIELMFKFETSRLNLFRHTKLKWELIPSNTLNAVHQLLNDPSVGNLILITHSVESRHKMIDSMGNQYPSTFFNHFSPNLMSISFLTCHSSDILETYPLQQTFTQSNSIHQKKVLNFIEANDLLESGTTAPLNGFGDFLRRIDRSLTETIQENMLAQTFHSNSNVPIKTRNTCTIELPDVRVRKGTLSLILNRNFIGDLNPVETTGQFKFDCSILKNDGEDNTLLLQNSRLIDESPIEFENNILPHRFFINGSILDSSNSEWKNFNSNEHYSSSKITFRGNYYEIQTN